MRWAGGARFPVPERCLPIPAREWRGAVRLNHSFLAGSGSLHVTNLAQFKPPPQELFSLRFANLLFPGGDRKHHISFHLESTRV